MNSLLQVRLEQLLLDSANQPRLDELDDDYVKQLADVPDLWPPITVVWKDDLYSVVDGFHRVEAAVRLQLPTIAATVLEMPADGDLLTLGFDINSRHGRALTAQDRQKYARHYLRKDPKVSDREISRRSGISAATVAKLRREMEPGAQIEQSLERFGADGRIYVPNRKPGELPDQSIGQSVSDGLRGLLGRRERRQMREAARYLQRLRVSLSDARDLKGWTSAEDVAKSCTEILGEAEARDLAIEMLPLVFDLANILETLSPSK